jgi:hypothetical protein
MSVYWDGNRELGKRDGLMVNLGGRWWQCICGLCAAK